MLNWLQVIGMIIRLIFSVQRTDAQAQNDRNTGLTEVAKAMCTLEPRLSYDCLLQVLPKFLNDLAALVTAGGLLDPRRIADLILTNVVTLIRCQMGTAQVQAERDVLRCGVQAGIVYFQTRDIGAAISAFLSCMFGGTTPPPGGGDGGTGNPPTGGDPSRPTFRDQSRC